MMIVATLARRLASIRARMRQPALVPRVVRRFVAANRWAWAVAGQTISGTWRDGFTNAGNLAYLSLVTMFPFFIVVAVVAGAFGASEDGMRAVTLFLDALPLQLVASLRDPIDEVVLRAAESTGPLLAISIVLMLWTISSTIEAIREILHNAYQVASEGAFWRYRLGSVLLIFGAVGLMMLAFVFQVALTSIEALLAQRMPGASATIDLLGLGRLVPVAVMLATLYLTIWILTPIRYRGGENLVWPGVALTIGVWLGTTMLLPRILSHLTGYDRTYGSFAGVIIALLFFYIIGMGLVLGIHLNAALAIVPRLRQKGRRKAAIQGA